MTSIFSAKKIAIHSVPRSGSSWVGQIFNSSPDVNFKFQPLFSYAFKGFLNETSSKGSIENFFCRISGSQDDFLVQRQQVEDDIYPAFKKNLEFTHTIYKEVRYHNILKNMMKKCPDVIVVGIIRNPYAVISSFFDAPREFRKDLGWNELAEWQYASSKNRGKAEEFFGFDKWKEVAKLFHDLKRKYPDRFYLVSYSDILRNTEQEVQSIFDFCGLKVGEQTQEFISQSRRRDKKDVYSVFKIKREDSDWKGVLDPKIIDAISKDLDGNPLIEYLDG